MEAILKLCY